MESAETAQPSTPAAAPPVESAAQAKKSVTITDAAVEYAKKRLAQRGTPDAAIRLGVRGGESVPVCDGRVYPYLSDAARATQPAPRAPRRLKKCCGWSSARP